MIIILNTGKISHGINLVIPHRKINFKRVLCKWKIGCYSYIKLRISVKSDLNVCLFWFVKLKAFYKENALIQNRGEISTNPERTSLYFPWYQSSSDCTTGQRIMPFTGVSVDRQECTLALQKGETSALHGDLFPCFFFCTRCFAGYRLRSQGQGSTFLVTCGMIRYQTTVHS